MKLTYSLTERTKGSHTPIDTDIHWRWDNPFNILPGAIVLVILVDMLAMLF